MNYKRKRPRTKPPRGVDHLKLATGGHPHWFDIVFHNRPKRRRDNARVREIVKGADYEGMTFDLGNKKPLQYYW